MLGVYKLTLKETISKKIFLTFFVLSTLFIILIMFALNVKVGGVDSKILLDFFGQNVNANQGEKLFNPKEILGYVQTGIAIAVFFISIFFSLFATAGIFPNFLKKGSIDLIISKPISREMIFIERFLGALTIVGINILYIVLLSWIVLSVKFEIWNYDFLFSGLIIFIFFSTLFSILAFVSVITRNTVVSLLIVYFTIFILSPILAAVQKFTILDGTYYKSIIKTLHFVLPKVSETVVMIKEVVMSENYSAAPLISSSIIGLIAVLASISIFKRIDF
ncbi:MAG: ABC transporter permease subunit [Candidatus Delongbacteria bacterium]|jgi:ABC-type transport system involved in multi-copper enzyme maturation permease subunit|nr:ABC transporter permease subunit [Candidatus Delongbacteria bacterium]